MHFCDLLSLLACIAEENILMNSKNVVSERKKPYIENPQSLPRNFMEIAVMLQELSDKTCIVFHKQHTLKLLLFPELPMCYFLDFSKTNIFKIIQAGILLAAPTLRHFRFL